ncbi:MAG TPA: protein jag [Clostridiales bacterium]|jgi:spoIIIJ-associated protein|nr:protein jag [Clostridiales bacterium]
MDFSEKWGRDIDEAVNLALADLKLDREQVKVIVLEEPSKGFLGFGSKLAKVRVEKKEIDQPLKFAEDKPPQKDLSDQRTKTEKREQQRGDNKSQPQAYRNRERQKPSSGKNNTETSVNGVGIRIRPDNMVPVESDPALDFLHDLTSRMGLNLTIKAMKNEECLYFDITGRDSGTVIGKRGQTLDSIQYLTSLVVNKGTANYQRVIVDAENYRQKREKTLEQLANRLADKVIRSGRSVRLEPMNPYERKVIHAALQKNSMVTTASEGEEPNRRVVIERK